VRATREDTSSLSPKSQQTLSPPTAPFFLPSSSHTMREPSPTLSDISDMQQHRESKSPVLASLEWLQTQRRGSITDPSMHTNANMRMNPLYRQSSTSDQPNPDSSGPSHHDPPPFRGHPSDPRPASSYVFGDATIPPVDHPSHLRKILHSPSTEQAPIRPRSTAHEPKSSSSRNIPGTSSCSCSTHPLF
jgi:hypothetical protein